MIRYPPSGGRAGAYADRRARRPRDRHVLGVHRPLLRRGRAPHRRAARQPAAPAGGAGPALRSRCSRPAPRSPRSTAGASAYLAASGVVGLVIGDLALFEALRRIGPRLALADDGAGAGLRHRWPGCSLLGERPGRLALLGIAVTLAGVGLGGGRAPRRARPRLARARVGVALARARRRLPGRRPGARQGRDGRARCRRSPRTWVRMGIATARDLGCSPRSPAAPAASRSRPRRGAAWPCRCSAARSSGRSSASGCRWSPPASPTSASPPR